MNRMQQIIQKEFDERLSGALVKTIIEMGFDKLRNYTEEKVMEQKSYIEQCLLRTAMKICKECDIYDDFIPYIITEMNILSAPMYNINLHKGEFTDSECFEKIQADLGVDDIDAGYIRLRAFVLDVRE